MRNIVVLARKEIAIYFLSPSSYVVLAIALFVIGYDYSSSVLGAQTLFLFPVFKNMAWLLTLLAPLITMRLFAEEAKSGTIETLMTCAVRDTEVVIGKFLASVFFMLVMLFPSVVYVVGVTRYFVRPEFTVETGYFSGIDYAMIACGYCSVVLAGCFFLAVGLFASSLCKNQIVAAVGGIVGLLVLSTMGNLQHLEGLGALRQVAAYVALPEHFRYMAQGGIWIGDVVYFVSLTAFFLFLTVRSLESRSWK